MAIPEVKAQPAAPPSPPQIPERKPDPCIVVIFGASGDLTKRKLLPALYHLEQSGLLPKDISVVGVARRPLESTFAPDMKDGIVSGGGVEEHDPKPRSVHREDQLLRHELRRRRRLRGPEGDARRASTRKSGTKGNRLFYLATAPEYFADIINSLGKHEHEQARDRRTAGSAPSSRSPSATTWPAPAR